jgi:hypothetical protein
MKLDPIPFMVARVKAVPGLPSGISIGADLDMHEPGTRRIDIELEGGRRVVRDRLDAWTFALNHYAALKSEAMASALLVREYLIEQAQEKRYDSVFLAGVEEEQAPTDIGDIDNKEQRIIHRVTIYIYEV